MKDEFYDNEPAELGFEQGEEEEIHNRMEMLARIAPSGVIQAVVEQAHENVQNTANKLGKLLGAAGHSTFRASLGHVPVQSGGNGSMVATVLVSLDIDGLLSEGHTVDEVRQALASSFDALNEYFKTLGPVEG